MRRRHFLRLSSSGALLYFTLDGVPKLEGQGAATLVPLRFFTEEQALVVAAATSRIFPTDESGPGANEAGVALYIDCQLAGPYGRDRYRYTKGPFVEGSPEQGYQSQATPREIYRQGITELKGFEKLSDAQKDEKLRSIETSIFFRLLRQHTMEGMFCDPMHGGNRNLIGWQLIGFPGPYMSWSNDIDQYFGKALRPKPQSLSQILNRKVTPWEELEP
jgi:gluconate 2-dehydrogenase gamma chain